MAQITQREERVLTNLRNRRKRQRERRAERKEEVNELKQNAFDRPQRPRRRPRSYRRGIALGKEEAKEQTAMQKGAANLDALMSEPLKRFCEAVVHPFGDGAVGATLPDKFQELVVPLTDKLELDLSPTNLNYPGSNGKWEGEADVELTGIFMWFQPRACGAGMVSNNSNTTTPPAIWNVVPFVSLNSDFSTSQAQDMLSAYTLCFTGIWSDMSQNGFGQVAYGLFNGGPTQETWIPPVYLSLQYSRFENIQNNCDKIRVLGAGLKLWSEQAPINTGGFSVGGWITLEDIYESLTFDFDQPVKPGSFGTIIDQIKYAYRSPGMKGSTVRYSCLQSSEQLQSEYANIPERLYEVKAQSNLVTPQWITPIVAADLSRHDLIEGGSFVPCILWHFNVVDSTTSSEVAQQYTLKVMSMVHSEGTPTGSCPFQMNKTQVDPGAEHVKLMLENVDVFPAATGGHSFKSFLTKTRHIVQKIGHYASKTQGIMKLVDKMFEM